jgi:hypothetical protein
MPRTGIFGAMDVKVEKAPKVYRSRLECTIGVMTVFADMRCHLQT